MACCFLRVFVVAAIKVAYIQSKRKIELRIHMIMVMLQKNSLLKGYLKRMPCAMYFSPPA